MNIHITGRHMETGAALQAHVETRLHDAVSKYFERSAEVTVTFSKQGHEFQAACALHLDSGLYLHASGAAQDVYACFDQSIGKIEKQLRRYKRRLKNHHDQKKLAAVIEAPLKILAPEAQGDVPAEFTPVVIAESKKQVSQLSVSEAVMQLELGEDDFVLFKSATRNNVNIVYKRRDGNIGWLELNG
ncbi:MAG: Ribosome hibernation promotion factor [Alphaproteobacteria bacterium]|nr:MAG: Ribosome hibernation promotion factor [Alphaproteobacteria bacterium]